MPSQIDTANNMYAEIEKAKPTSNIDIELVRVTSFHALKSAYPNYFSDTGEFLARVRAGISGVNQNPVFLANTLSNTLESMNTTVDIIYMALQKTLLRRIIYKQLPG